MVRMWRTPSRAGVRRHPGRRPSIAGAGLAALAVLASCAGVMEKSPDFDRHRHSQLSQPFDRPGVLYFDVTFTPEFPADDPAAEQARLQWLGQWLEQRRLCAQGFEVPVRRAFDYLEDNPAHRDQRWEVRCRSGG